MSLCKEDNCIPTNGQADNCTPKNFTKCECGSQVISDTDVCLNFSKESPILECKKGVVPTATCKCGNIEAPAHKGDYCFLNENGDSVTQMCGDVIVPGDSC